MPCCIPSLTSSLKHSKHVTQKSLQRTRTDMEPRASAHQTRRKSEESGGIRTWAANRAPCSAADRGSPGCCCSRAPSLSEHRITVRASCNEQLGESEQASNTRAVARLQSHVARRARNGVHRQLAVCTRETTKLAIHSQGMAARSAQCVDNERMRTAISSDVRVERRIRGRLQIRNRSRPTAGQPE